MLQHYGLHVPLLQRALVTERWKLIYQEDGFCELYDLARDPAELSNLAEDADRRSVVEDMTEVMAGEMTRPG